MTRNTPVTTITTSPYHIHGANRAHTAANGSSARMRPITRNAIMRLDTNTTPIVTMWIDCSSGIAQVASLIAWLSALVSSAVPSSFTPHHSFGGGSGPLPMAVLP